MSKKPEKGQKKKPQQQQQPSFQKWIWLGVILILTYISFAPSMDNEWTNWDDPVYVLENPLITNLNTPTKDLLTKPVSLNYHPLTMLSLKWNYESVKTEPHAYHLTNVLLHLINTALVFFFILMLSESLVMAVFVSALFGVHPMHVESVSWISERKDVLYVLFFVLGMICYLKYLDTKKVLWMIITVTVFILSCLSKAMAVVFPVVLLLIDYLKNRELNFKIVLEKIPLFIISLIVGIAAFTIQATDAIAKPETFTILQRIMFASYGAWLYVVKFFVPINLSAFYPYPLSDNGVSVSIEYYLAPVAWLAVAAIVFFFFRKHKPIVFGLLFYFASVVLVLQFISVGSAIAADRYSYLSYIGLSFILGWLLNQFFVKGNKLYNMRMVATSVAAVCILVFAYQTNARTKVWKNTETLWTDVINQYPNRIEVAYKNRGNYYGKEKGMLKEAMADYKVLLSMKTKDSKIYSNLGNIYGLMKNGDSAIWAYNTALQMDDKNTDAYVNRAITYSMAGRYDLAFPDYTKALQIDPSMYSTYINRGYAYLASGKLNEALADFNYYLIYDPNNAACYYYRGLTYTSMGNTSNAKNDFVRAQSLGYKVEQKYLQ